MPTARERVNRADRPERWRAGEPWRSRKAVEAYYRQPALQHAPSFY